MNYTELETNEKQSLRLGKKIFVFDLSVVFAAASLLIILLYAGVAFDALLTVLKTPLSKLFAYVFGIPRGTFLGSYGKFLDSEIYKNALTLFPYLLSIFIPVLFAGKFLKNKPAKFYPFKGEMPKKSGSFIFFAIGSSFAVNILSAVLLGRFYPKIAEGSGGGGLLTTVVTFITVVVIAPFGEELVFRGVFFQSLDNYSRPFAIFISAFAFGLAHRNPPSVINAFVVGIFLAIGFAKTGSLVVCVLIHAANNAFAMLASSLISLENGVYAAILIGLAILSVVFFAIGLYLDYAVTKSAPLVSYPNEISDLPRLPKRELMAALAKNFFFWFYLSLAAAGAALFYF